MARLSDTAATILTNAAAHDDYRVLPLPKLKAPPVAVQRTLTSLLADGHIEEIAADPMTKRGSSQTNVVVSRLS